MSSNQFRGTFIQFGFVCRNEIANLVQHVDLQGLNFQFPSLYVTLIRSAANLHGLRLLHLNFN